VAVISVRLRTTSRIDTKAGITTGNAAAKKEGILGGIRGMGGVSDACSADRVGISLTRVKLAAAGAREVSTLLYGISDQVRNKPNNLVFLPGLCSRINVT